MTASKRPYKKTPKKTPGKRASGTARRRGRGRSVRLGDWRRHPFLPLILLALCVAALLAPPENVAVPPEPGVPIACANPYIIDGDTLDCAGSRIRLQGIDAPEMPGHCRPGRDCTPGDPYAAKAHLKSLSRGIVRCTPVDTDIYGRIVARCAGAQGDLSCAMIEAGFAVRRYGVLSCPD